MQSLGSGPHNVGQNIYKNQVSVLEKKINGARHLPFLGEAVPPLPRGGTYIAIAGLLFDLFLLRSSFLLESALSVGRKCVLFNLFSMICILYIILFASSNTRMLC